MSIFLDLPDELIDMVFLDLVTTVSLGHLRLVSREFTRAWDRNVSRLEIVQPVGQDADQVESCKRSLTRKMTSVESLKIDMCPSFFLHAPVDFCKNIKTLTIQDVATPVVVGGAFFENLEWLMFVDCADPLEAMVDILGKSRRVKKFWFHCDHPDMHREIGKALDLTQSRIEEFEFSNTTTDTSLMGDMIPSLAKHAPTLEALWISCHHDTYERDNADELFDTVLSKAPRLIKLHLDELCMDVDSLFRSLSVSGCPLEELTLTHCELTNDDVLRVNEHLSGLPEDRFDLTLLDISTNQEQGEEQEQEQEQGEEQEGRLRIDSFGPVISRHCSTLRTLNMTDTALRSSSILSLLRSIDVAGRPCRVPTTLTINLLGEPLEQGRASEYVRALEHGRELEHGRALASARVDDNPFKVELRYSYHKPGTYDYHTIVFEDFGGKVESTCFTSR
jgi:hypothetical protein